MGIYRDRKEKQLFSKRKVEIAGALTALISTLFFVLSCLPLGGFSMFLLGTFGVSVYPAFLLLTLFGIGLFLSNKYHLQKRYFVYLVLNFVILVCLLHTAIDSKTLANSRIQDYGTYIKNCYFKSPKLTVGGALFGAVIYPLTCLIGVVGSCIVFAILLCVFVGLAVDFMFARKNKLSRKDYERNRRVIDEVDYDSSFSSLAQDYDTRSEKLVPRKFEKEDYERYSPIQNSNKGAEYYSNRLNSGGAAEQIVETVSNNENDAPTFDSAVDSKVENQKSSRDSAYDLLFGNKKQEVGENITSTIQKPEFVKSPEEKYPSKYDPSIFASKKEYITTPILPDYLNFKEIDRQMVLDRNKAREVENKTFDDVSVAKNEGFSGDFIPSYSVVGESTNQNDKIEPEKITTIAATSEVSEENFDEILPEREPTLKQIDCSEVIEGNDVARDLDISEILPKQTFSRNTNFENDSENDFRPIRNVRGPDRQPRKTPERTRNLSDMVIDETKELPKVSAPLSMNFGERASRNSAPIQTSFLEKEKPSFNVKKVSIEDSKYVAPDPRLLTTVSDDPNKVSGDVEKRSRVLEETLDSFKIPAKVINVVKGPSVTRYELQVPAGIPVKKLSTYENDIAMTLMSKNGVRLELPIPGKNAVGVEIPNDIPCTVGLRDVIMSKEFQSASGALPVAIGKNINGEFVVESLAKMVHLLIAGSTGSGKSVFLHNIILSLMFKSSPEQLRFIMIDPKKVEFNIYTGMPHMMLPNVVTESDKAINALSWAVKEMERRYRMFNQNLVNNIKSFNSCDAVKNGEEKKIPYIVIVIDELADLMMLAQKEVSKHIQRIAQLGRACGIHLVIATQRPTVQVVTGTIKTNLPTRVAFSLTSAIDSQTILDEGGAEKLIGRGDMLYSPQGKPPERLQSAFADTDEVMAVVKFLKEHNACYYDEEVENEIMAEPAQETADISTEGGGKGDSVDEFFYPALKLFIETGTASTTMIQRRFGVGFARAARLVDQMELKGYVSPQNGSKKRNVYITMEQYRELSGDET